ncbi:MAG TPA: DHH family phosphoesterase, partial [Bacilli bacterium]|nr:DHH family phosphoesterase [Bacilli bacterium]
MFKDIYKQIKKYNNIVITRHTSPDLDALGAQLGLKDVILNTFPNKKVYAIGAYSKKHKYMGSLDKETDDMFKDSLLIVLDNPIIRRIDMSNVSDISKFDYRMKIDHHPFEEKFCDLEYIDESSSSASEMIVDICNNTKLKMNKKAAEKLFMGIIFDTNRFLYPCSSTKTMRVAADLIDKYSLDKSELYEKSYMRSLDEIRFQGYVFQNLKVTKNGVG